MRERVGVALALGALVALGAALRLPGLADWQLSWDDMWHLQDALQESLGAVLDRNLHAQVHGPVHYVLLHAGFRVAPDPFALRWISLAPGLLLIPACYLLGRELLGRGAGLFLAAGAAVSYRLVALSQVLRPYPAMLLWLVLSLTCLLRWERGRGRRWLAGYAVLAALAAFTQVASLIALGAVAAVWALRIARRGGALHAAAWLSGNALLLAAPAAYALVQLHFASARAAGPGGDLERFLDHFWYFRSTFPTGGLDALARLVELLRRLVFPPEAAVASWLLVAASAAGLVLLVQQRRATALALAAGVVAAAMAFGLLGLFPFAATRHCAYLVPFLLLPAACLAELAYERLDGRLFALLAAAALLLLVNPSPAAYRRPREDFDTRRADLERVLSHLASRAGPRDVVIVNRVGMQYLNLEEQLAGARLEHVGHAGGHVRYPYDRWVLPGEEEHVLRGVRFWGCDGVHEWASWFVERDAFVECLRALSARHPEGLGRVWFLVEKADMFLAFASPRPLAALPRGSRERRLLAQLRDDALWKPLFAARDRLRTPTAGTFRVPWRELARGL